MKETFLLPERLWRNNLSFSVIICMQTYNTNVCNWSLFFLQQQVIWCLQVIKWSLFIFTQEQQREISKSKQNRTAWHIYYSSWLYHPFSRLSNKINKAGFGLKSLACCCVPGFKFANQNSVQCLFFLFTWLCCLWKFQKKKKHSRCLHTSLFIHPTCKKDETFVISFFKFLICKLHWFWQCCMPLLQWWLNSSICCILQKGWEAGIYSPVIFSSHRNRFETLLPSSLHTLLLSCRPLLSLHLDSNAEILADVSEPQDSSF